MAQLLFVFDCGWGLGAGLAAGFVTLGLALAAEGACAWLGTAAGSVTDTPDEPPADCCRVAAALMSWSR